MRTVALAIAFSVAASIGIVPAGRHASAAAADPPEAAPSAAKPATWEPNIVEYLADLKRDTPLRAGMKVDELRRSIETNNPCPSLHATTR